MARVICTLLPTSTVVMAGRGPAIHDFPARSKSWMPVASTGMTAEVPRGGVWRRAEVVDARAKHGHDGKARAP